MAEKGENLAVVHLHVDAANRRKSTGEGLLEVLNAQVVSGALKALADDRRGFVVILGHLLPFKSIVLLTVDKGLLIGGHSSAIAVSSAAAVVARRA